MREVGWMQDLVAKLQTHIRECRGSLLPLLDTLAEDALQRGALDELYVINSLRIIFLSKYGERERVFALRQQQREIQALVSTEIVRDFDIERATLFAGLLLRAGQLEEAQQELQRLLECVPLSHNELPEVVQLLAGLYYSYGDFQGAIQFWRSYIHLVELYALLATKELLSPHAFRQVNLVYPQGIRYLFEMGDEGVRKQVVDGCIRACRLVLSSAGRYVAVSMDDIPFLQMVEQWLRVQGLIEEADDIARCIDLYKSKYQTYLQAMSGKESVLESKRENNNM